jgi:hypothetical protein
MRTFCRRATVRCTGKHIDLLMGHERWRSARDANRTTCGLLTQIAHNQAINYGEFIAHEIGDVKLSDGRKPTLDVIPSTHGQTIGQHHGDCGLSNAASAIGYSGRSLLRFNVIASFAAFVASSAAPR